MMTRIVGAVAICVALAVPAGASAAWEKPQPISLGAGTVASPAAGAQGVEAVAGSSGLATALFFVQGQDKAFLTRRSHDQASWGAAQEVPVPGHGRRLQRARRQRGGRCVRDLGQRPEHDADERRSLERRRARARVGRARDGGIWPDLEMDASGNAYAVARHPDGRILFGRFDAASGAWSQRELSPAGSTTFAVEPQVAVNEAGDVVAIG